MENSGCTVNYHDAAIHMPVSGPLINFDHYKLNRNGTKERER
jgi:hypothetical protein